MVDKGKGSKKPPKPSSKSKGAQKVSGAGPAIADRSKDAKKPKK